MILSHMLDTCYLSSFFLSITFINYASSNSKIQLGPINSARDQHEYRHKLGKIGPSHLLSEHGGLSLVVFFKTVLGREHSGKVTKNSSVNLVS